VFHFLIAAFFTLFSTSASAIEPTPAMYKAMEIIDSRGTKLPLEAPLIDSNGQTRSIGDWMNQRTPLVLTFNYMGCPMLCGLQQDGLVETINKLQLQAGRDFHIVTVSIDPNESADSIRRATESMSDRIDADWTVLRGSSDSISALTTAAGFQYQWVEETQEFAHPTATYILTNEGTVSQYFTALSPQPRDLNLALLEAGQGQIGSIFDQVTLSCLQYDVTSNSYVARDVMQAGGFAIMGGLVVFFALMWRRERARWS
jgi:protein SCO1/2